MHTILEKIGGIFRNNKHRILVADVFMLAFGLVMIIFPSQSQESTSGQTTLSGHSFMSSSSGWPGRTMQPMASLKVTRRRQM